MPRKRKRIFKYILSYALFFLIVLMFSIAAKSFFPLKYKDLVFKYASKNSVDPYLVFAIIKVESGFKPLATSPKNARGLMQISDRTGAWGAESLKIKDFSSESLYDPEINIMIGCWYLNMLMKEFKDDIDLVIVAYNGGSGNVNEWLKDIRYSDSGKKLDRIPFKETQEYVVKVKRFFAIYKWLYDNKQEYRSLLRVRHDILP